LPIRKYFLMFFRIKRHLKGHYIVLDCCHAMYIQWKDKTGADDRELIESTK
jgi:hypothetical protein